MVRNHAYFSKTKLQFIEFGLAFQATRGLPAPLPSPTCRLLTPFAGHRLVDCGLNLLKTVDASKLLCS